MVMSNYDDCDCRNCILSRINTTSYYPCCSKKLTPISIESVPIPHTHNGNVTGNNDRLFDAMKIINSVKHKECDTRKKAAFNNNLDKSISYLLKAIKI